MLKRRSIAMYCTVALLLVVSIVSFQRIETVNAIPTISGNMELNEKNVKPVVVIDAGHGGVDGGAVGIDGTVEKDINLSIALKLRDLLQFYGFETVMIREDDISIHNENAETIRQKKTSDLKNRLKIANETENSIFISIHQNYFEQEKYWGTQVFYSPNDENSKLLAQIMQSSIVDSLQNDNKREIKEAQDNLYILYNVKNPAIMVECGFMSNSSDLSLLKSDEYQTKLAVAISNGILKYESNLQNENTNDVSQKGNTSQSSDAHNTEE